jgi:hypothetical protein
MPHETHLTPEAAAFLATVWIILLGAALMPLPVILARLAVRFAVRETLAALLKWAVIALAGALAIASATPVPAAAAEACAPVVAARPSQALSTAIGLPTASSAVGLAQGRWLTAPTRHRPGAPCGPR